MMEASKPMTEASKPMMEASKPVMEAFKPLMEVSKPVMDTLLARGASLGQLRPIPDHRTFVASPTMTTKQALSDVFDMVLRSNPSNVLRVHIPVRYSVCTHPRHHC